MKDTIKRRVHTRDDLDEAIETLVDAGEIMRDPALLKVLKEHARIRKGQLSAVDEITSIADLRSLYQEMNEPKEPKAQKAKGKKPAKKPADLKELRKMADEKNSKEEEKEVSDHETEDDDTAGDKERD